MNSSALNVLNSSYSAIIERLLKLTPITYLPMNEEGELNDLHYKRFKVCADNHHCRTYIIIAQNIKDIRAEDEIKRLFQNKADLNKAEFLIEKYENND